MSEQTEGNITKLNSLHSKTTKRSWNNGRFFRWETETYGTKPYFYINFKYRSDSADDIRRGKFVSMNEQGAFC